MAQLKNVWADQPFKLCSLVQPIEDPGRQQFLDVANEMVAVHTVLARWLNSIYLQAPHIPQAERKNFIEYTLAWARTLHHHHEGEETFVFEDLEKTVQLPGIMQKNVEQHHVFQGAVQKFIDYMEVLQKDPAKYDGNEVVRLIDVFAPPLLKHLDDEIDTLVALPDQLPAGLEPKDVPYAEMAVRCGKRATGAMKLVDLYGFLANHDRTYIKGYLREPWPPAPKPIVLFMGYVMPYIHGSVYKFSSCDMFGQPKELPFAPAKA